MKDMKFRIKDEEQSKELQYILFSLGYNGAYGDGEPYLTDKPFLYTKSGEIVFSDLSFNGEDSFLNDQSKEICTEHFINENKHIVSENNGGKTDYYQLSSAPFEIKDFDDFAEWRKLNGFQFNIGKVVWTFNVGRHSGTDEIRDLNKIIHYAEKEKQRIMREE